MSKKLYPEEDIQNIANAIRNLNGSSDSYTVSEMASAIALPENGFYLKESTEANPLSITDGEELNAQSCEVSFEPVQDLHGYDSPWIDSDVINKEPYLFRPVRGTAPRIGNSLYDTLVGGTIAFNQLVKNGNFASTNYWSTYVASFSVASNICSFTASARYGAIKNNINATNTSHKYLIKCDMKLSTATTSVMFGMGNSYIIGGVATKSTTDWQTLYAIQSGNADYLNIRVADYRTSDWDSIQVKNVICIDLTQMFGSTIADYIYSLEQATAGSGVAYFRSLFPKDYYDYNAGQLMSVKALSHKMVGFNQWDEEWELGGIDSVGQLVPATNRIRSKNYIRLFSGKSYYVKTALASTDLRIAFYDSEKAFISNSSWMSSAIITAPTNAVYAKFVIANSNTYNNNICINLHWDGERDGEYEAYEEHIYPLDSDLELRGIPKLDSNNKLYYDGDTYESDGTVTRRYGVVDLGTLNWTKRDNVSVFLNSSMTTIIKKVSATTEIPTWILCSRIYKSASATNTYTGDSAYNYTISVNNNGYIIICNNDYTDATTFKTAMSGVYLVYELATPTTETADTFQNPQLVSNWGTEEYTDSRTVQIPVGHETYQANICEISGWSGLSLNQRGKNLFDETTYYTANNFVKQSDGSWYISNNATLTNAVFFNNTMKYQRQIKLKYLYKYANSTGSAGLRVKIFYTDGTNITDYPSITTTLTERTITTDSGKIVEKIGFDYGSSANGTYLKDFLITFNENSGEYESYQGTTHTATFSDTVYGGKHEFVSGKAKSEWGYIELDGTENWSLQVYSGINTFLLPRPSDSVQSDNLISNQYATATVQTARDGTIYFGSINMAIADNSKADLNAFKSALATNHLQVCYKRATPTEITLTPSQIALLENNNVLWSDSNGNVKLKYFSKSLS